MVSNTADAAASILEGQAVFCVFQTRPPVYEVREGTVISVSLTPPASCYVSFGGVLQRPELQDVFLSRDAADTAALERTEAAAGSVSLAVETVNEAFEILSATSEKSLAEISEAIQVAITPQAPPAPVVEEPPAEETLEGPEGTPKP